MYDSTSDRKTFTEIEISNLSLDKLKFLGVHENILSFHPW